MLDGDRVERLVVEHWRPNAPCADRGTVSKHAGCGRRAARPREGDTGASQGEDA